MQRALRITAENALGPIDERELTITSICFTAECGLLIGMPHIE